MLRRKTGLTVFDEAIERMKRVFEDGHRVVVAFSGGKDSTVTLETTLIAAAEVGRLPVDVIMRDEEIMLPGTFEYAARVADRANVNFHWIYACQPVINVFNRENPYFWVFDPLLEPDEWVRKPPTTAYRIPDLNIQRIVIKERFPPVEGKDLFVAMGVRADESAIRKVSVASAGGHLTLPNKHGTRHCRPIYDFTDGDVWKAIGENKWDYNNAYDVMARTGLKRRDMRIAPPSQNPMQVPIIQMASQAWPSWFDKVCKRLPGFRSVANYGAKVLTPSRGNEETWEQTYKRACIDRAPAWISARASETAGHMRLMHSRHATGEFPQVEQCLKCQPGMGSWRALTRVMFLGDPFAMKCPWLKYVEPEFFRPGAGIWGGKPSF